MGMVPLALCGERRRLKEDRQDWGGIPERKSLLPCCSRSSGLMLLPISCRVRRCPKRANRSWILRACILLRASSSQVEDSISTVFRSGAV